MDLIATQTLSQAGKDQMTTTTARVWVKRPRKLLSLTQGPAWASIFYSNGTSTTTYRPALNRYVVSELGAEPDAHLAPVESQYGPLVASILAAEPLKSAPSIKVGYAGVQNIGKIPCHHLKFSGMLIDSDIWFTETTSPLPVVLVSKQRMPAPAGKPESQSQQSRLNMVIKWETGLDLDDVTFAFLPPPNSKQVASLAEALSETTGTIEVGESAPDLKLPLHNGGTFDLAAFRGKKIVVLDFWATWCHGCQKAMSEMAELEQKYRSRGVEICAIDVKETSQTAAAFLAENKVKLTVALDTEGQAATLFKVRNIPQTIIVGMDGRVKAVEVGYSPESKSLLVGHLERILKK